MSPQIRLVSEAWHVVRPVTICVIGIAVVGYAMAMAGHLLAGVVLAAALVAIAAAAIFQVCRVVNCLRRQSDSLRAAAAEAERHYIDVLRRVMRIVEAREQYAAGHSDRIGKTARQMAMRLGLPEEQCELLGLAGELHDIGLLAIPEGILCKHSRLGVEEFREIQKHSQIGYEILRPLESLAQVLSAVRHHHERMNGTGYPDGLQGDAIPLGAKILAVADAYDAMTHDRPQRAAMSPLSAVQELLRCTPSGYDQRCVEALGQGLHAADLEKAMAPAQESAKDGGE